MFTLLGYCGTHLINEIGNIFNNLSFLLTMHEAPLDLNDQSNIDHNKSSTDLDKTETLESEDDTRKVESIGITYFVPDNTHSPNPNLNNTDISLQSVHLNDTLEEVEFMMEQGLKILNNTTNSDKTPIRSCKKSAIISNFDYVKSPIGAYIKHSPLTPLRRNNNTHQRFHLETLNESSFTCDDDNHTDKQSEAIVVQEKRCTFPRKAYINSARNQIIYENVLHRRHDGRKMQKLFGDSKKSPTVIKHYGRLRTKTLSQRKENIPIDDTFNDFSFNCDGDISLHVVKNAKQN